MTVNIKYCGRLSQIGIYFKKFLRMFVYQSDWKVLPMSAAIVALVTLVVGTNMFVTQEGTTFGTFALTCVCIWNGVFNSIQVVCRERDIVKREHRAGMHISSYILAHMLYQLLLCILQAGITVLICWIVGIQFPAAGVITPLGIVDFGITILLITYASDMIGLMISCIVRTTTTAMTVMPFLLIFQLIFSGGFFELGSADFVKVATISHWGMDSLCTVAHFNELPMVTIWNMLVGFKDEIMIGGVKPLKDLLIYMEKTEHRDLFLHWTAERSANPAYDAVASNVWLCWGVLLLMIVLFAVVAVIALKLVDRDKR